jgi:hypothetical protein
MSGADQPPARLHECVKVWAPFPDGEVPDGWPRTYVSEADYNELLSALEHLKPDREEASYDWAERAIREINALRGTERLTDQPSESQS